MAPGQNLLQTINNKRGKLDAVKEALELVTEPLEELSELDAQGRTALHNLAILGNDECIELLIEKADKHAPTLVNIQDKDGCTPLHLSAASPMVCYMLAAQSPATCLLKNSKGSDPIDLAAKHGSGESLNALLLACSGSSTPEALDAITQLTAKGAVPDTWAPNGQSALMLAAAADSAAAVKLLLSKGASLELADALGRTALMWAAGCNGAAAMTALLDAGASVAHRDRRGRTLEDYAAEFPDAKAVLNARVSVMESRAAAAQEALLAELSAEEERKEAAKASKRAKKKEKKAAKEKKKGVSAGVSVCSEVPMEDSVLEVSFPTQQQQQPGKEDDKEKEHAHSIVQLAEYTDRSTSDEGTTTPPQATSPTAVSSRATSPEWCTVGKNTRSATKGTGSASGVAGSSLMAGSFPPSALSNAVGGVGRGTLISRETSHHKRSPSSTSVASTCSVASHDTELSRHSGSERSVLRRGSGGTSPPPMPRLPAQSTATRKPSVLSRASSAADEAVPSRDSAWQIQPQQPSVACAKVPIASQGTTNSCSWASIATGQRHHARNDSVSAEEVSASPASALPLPTSALGMAMKEEEDAKREDAAPSSVSAPTAVATTSSAPAAPASEQLVQEIIALRAEIKRLHVQQATSELAHQRELADVLQDAARHEGAAVAQAVSDERMSCVVRFAGFLQNNDAALAAAIPNLLVGVAPSTNEMDVHSVLHPNIYGEMNSARRLERSKIDGAEPQRLDAATLSSLGFPPLTSSSRNVTGAMMVASPTAIPAKEEASNPSSLFEDVCSPLSTSPFSFEVGEFLRGEFSGNHSAFVQPASETETGTPPPSSATRSPFDAHPHSSRPGPLQQQASLGMGKTTPPSSSTSGRPSWIAAWP